MFIAFALTYEQDLISLSLQQVIVQMEYSRKVTQADGPTISGAADRFMDFGSVFLPSSAKGDSDEVAASSAAAIAVGQPAGVNIAELVLARGFGNVVRHRDFEERSNYYDALLAAEARALSGKKGIHSAKESPAMHVTDLTGVSEYIYMYIINAFSSLAFIQ